MVKRDMHGEVGMHGSGACGRGVCTEGGTHGRGHGGETSTEAGGTHPIGIHSCLYFVIIQLTEKFKTMTFVVILIHHDCILSHLHEWYPMSTMTHSHSPC